MGNKNIIFNLLPPARKNCPSPALSILKSFLTQNNYYSNIIYWNLLLDTMLERERKLIKDLLKKDALSFLPYLLILAEEYNDRDALNNILFSYNKLDINKLIGEDLLHTKDYNYKYLIEIKNKVLNIISTELNKIDFNEVFLWGISRKFQQWIPGYILAREIKKRNPLAPIVIGGFGNKESAIEVLKTCKYFDYAIYGEGEYPLLDLCKFIEKGTPEPENISRLVYRENQELKISKNKVSKYLDFDNYIFPDFSDYSRYIKNIPEIQKKEIIYPINSKRSCHWLKCKFCDFNVGYKYRERSPESIVQEIEDIVDKYGMVKISFVDNDFIGKDFTKFEYLLDLLIASNLKHDLKYILYGEIIINQNLNFAIYKKIHLAGFKTLFGGYEAVTDGLLKKMDKHNRFADNILFLKACNKYNIFIEVNIIQYIPEETALDIKESTKNLHYLRFFFHGRLYDFFHYGIIFSLTKDMIYYKSLSEDEKQKYKPEKLYESLPSKFISDPFNLFAFLNNEYLHKNEWEIFII